MTGLDRSEWDACHGLLYKFWIFWPDFKQKVVDITLDVDNFMVLECFTSKK